MRTAGQRRETIIGKHSWMGIRNVIIAREYTLLLLDDSAVITSST